MGDHKPAPQTFKVQDAPHYMERPIEVTVTEHPNERHSNATKIFLTREESYALVTHLMLYLTNQTPEKEKLVTYYDEYGRPTHRSDGAYWA